MKTIVLSFDDAVMSQRTFVAPLLKELGFNATFFICRWGDEWRSQHGEYLMGSEEIHELSEMGFDIGNHTWSHRMLKDMTPESLGEEIDRLDDFLRTAKVPQPVSFAYPGGPGAEYAHDVLKKRGYRCARTVREVAFDPKTDDPFDFPSVALQDNEPERFPKALPLCTEERPLALLFHGVPDVVHPWVTQTPEGFRKYMNFLKEGGYRVISFRDYMANLA